MEPNTLLRSTGVLNPIDDPTEYSRGENDNSSSGSDDELSHHLNFVYNSIIANIWTLCLYLIRDTY